MNVIYQNYGWNVQSVFALLKPKPKPLITENSTLIKHGMLGFFSPSSMKRKTRYFFLFDRAMLVTAPMKKKFRLKIYIHLRPGVELIDDPDETQFRLNVLYKGKGMPMIMYADSIKEKNAWIRDIDAVLWKIRDGDTSLEGGTGVFNSATATGSGGAATADARTNRKPAYVQSKEDEKQRRSRSNTTGTIGTREGPMALDLNRVKGEAKAEKRRSKVIYATHDSAHAVDESDSESDDEDEKARQQKKRERRAQAPKSARGETSGVVSPRAPRSADNPVSPRDPKTNPVSPRGLRTDSPVSPRGQRSDSYQNMPVSPRGQPSAPGSLPRQDSSLGDVTRGLEAVNLGPSSPYNSQGHQQQMNYQTQQQYQPYGSNPAVQQQMLQQAMLQQQQQQLGGSTGSLPQVTTSSSFGSLPVLQQQAPPMPARPQSQSPSVQPQVSSYAQPLSPPTSGPVQQPSSPGQQPQSGQPMMYAVPAMQGGQQGTYYMDATAYANYMQQLQMQQFQLMQQQQMLQQAILQQQASGGSPGSGSLPVTTSSSFGSLPMMTGQASVTPPTERT
eukprot:TRINITY_DN3186_c0_g1_i1.p2 TRINITY_DN3186_c0_g1~~TRINITY_DN3186_c0_g1_i1.p2  ORF type:complete len:558 (+),score=127.46 TRINITY_DN3186_c0_g1_i1:1764-3437(+)